MKLRRKLLAGAVIGSIAFVSQSARAQEICLDLYRKVHSAIDAAYLRSKNEESNPQQKASTEVNLLNETFTPIMYKYNEVMQRVDSIQIREELLSAERAQPLLTARFSYFYRNAPKLTKGGGQALQAIVNHNAQQATDVHKVNLAPEMFRLSEFYYGTPKQEYINSLGAVHRQLSSSITPIGEYGKEFAEDSMRTVQILMSLSFKELQQASKETYESAPNLLVDHTARAGNAYRERADVSLAPVSAVLEGVMSFHQMITMLLANKIPGIENGHEALRELVNADSKLGLTSEVTMQLPMGFTGPSSISGYAYRNALYFEGNKLMLAPHIKEYLKTRRENAERRRRDNVRRKCPVASFLRGTAPKPSNHETLKQMSGIQMIAESYLKVFEVVRAQRLAREQYARDRD